MKIHICSAYREHNALDTLQRAATQDVHGEHTLCDDPEKADVILFVEDAQFDDYLYTKLITHKYLKHWRHKCYMYNEVDQPWTALPGLFCSMPKWSFEHKRQRAFPYIATPNQHIQHIYTDTAGKERPLLYSFVGTGCNSLRKRMIKISQQQPSSTIVDTSGFNVWDCDEEEKRQQGLIFSSTMAQSKFVLCPRGLGSSSFRLFETMQAGRAPVIIADSWVPPNQSDWSFAVRIKENDLDSIANRLGAIADEAHDRGEAARQAWENHYAPEQIFHSACTNLAELKENRADTCRSLISSIRRAQVRLDLTAMQVASLLRVYKRRETST